MAVRLTWCSLHKLFLKTVRIPAPIQGWLFEMRLAHTECKAQKSLAELLQTIQFTLIKSIALIQSKSPPHLPSGKGAWNKLNTSIVQATSPEAFKSALAVARRRWGPPTPRTKPRRNPRQTTDMTMVPAIERSRSWVRFPLVPGFFQVESYQWQKLALHWLPCQSPGVIGSAVGLVGLVPIYCDFLR